jgi:photosystem II stability/assembly factor-like uncharacterized protein
MNNLFRKSVLLLLASSFCVITLSTPRKNSDKKLNQPKDTVLSAALSGAFSFRSIGPAWASGRISDLAVNPTNNYEYYAAVACGNVFKTTNNGTTWTPIFDNYGSHSIGVVKLDPNNSNIVWVGTGENNHQRALGYGDGVYKSVDGGKSFTNMGLNTSRQIGGIVIDPRNSDVVFVACEGSVWGPGGERGLYKTTDGGKNWNKVLNISENTGVNNIIIDPSNPDILYATSEQRRRHHYGKIGGGPESAVYKSTDNGNSWRKIMKGLPSVDIGGMGIDVSPANPNYVYLIIEAAKGKSGFYRSTDKGESWERRSDYASSGQYYNEIFCDPKDTDKVYSMDTYTHYTLDGGKTWQRLSNKGRHVDDHALWIDPKNTDHLIIGGDGGIYESFDMGMQWDFKENLPVTQFYRVAVDNAKPFYNVLGGTQDNNSMRGPSRNTKRNGIANHEWVVTQGGDGFWIAADPRNPDIVYTEWQYGNMSRLNMKTGERTNIKPQERKGEPTYKWNWNTPMFISHHNYDRIYCAANKVFCSDDMGQTWNVISDDLTAQKDRDELKFMDKFWSADAVAKHVSTSQWGTIVSLDESRLKNGLLYVGSDDGVFSVTDDNGKTWKQHKNFPGVPEFTYISDIQADKHDENTVYISFSNLKRDDFTPYIFKSTDKGQTWNSIAGNLPENQTIHAIQQDFVKSDILFVGTEFGVYTTVDGGKNWVQLKAGIPTQAIYDMTIQEEWCDLVVATFGRGFYILDDYSPLRTLKNVAVNAKPEIFDIKDALMYVQTSHHTNQGSTYFTAPNPDYGASVYYYLPEVPKSKQTLRRNAEKSLFEKGEFIPQPSWRELQLEEKEEVTHVIFTIRDDKGNEVRKLTVSPSKGLNKVTWDLKYASINPVQTNKFNPLEGTPAGRNVLPGKYSMDMRLWHEGNITQLAEPIWFNVVSLIEADKNMLSQSEEFALKTEAMVASFTTIQQVVTDAYTKVEQLKRALYSSRISNDALASKLRELSKRIEAIDFTLNGVNAKASWEEIPPAQVPLSRRVWSIAYVRNSNTLPVTGIERQGYEIVTDEMEAVKKEISNIIELEIPSIEDEMDKYNIPWTRGRKLK